MGSSTTATVEAWPRAARSGEPARSDPRRQDQPGRRVDPRTGHHERRQNGEGAEDSRAEPTASPGPEPGRHGQEDSHAREQDQIGERDQPDEVPAHQVQAIGGVDAPAQDPRPHLEPPGGQAAAGGKPQHIPRAELVAMKRSGKPAGWSSSGSHRLGMSRRPGASPGGLLPGGDSRCRPRVSRDGRPVPRATGLRRNRPCGTARARNGAGDHRLRHSSRRRGARRPGDGRRPRRRSAPRRRRGWTSSPRDET